MKLLNIMNGKSIIVLMKICGDFLLNILDRPIYNFDTSILLSLITYKVDKIVIPMTLLAGDPWVKVHHEGALTADQVSLIKTALTVGPDLPPAYRMTRVTDVLH